MGIKKVTVNLPEDLLKKTQALLHKGITETLVSGLEEIIRRHQLKALSHLRGKIKFNLDLKKTRQ
ncbi:MAG: hypothetical protein HYY62_00780 [Deltaproteobacteria bacterium]|nr:hypothetical protein [Deltaproteobacteria bacterium]